MVHGNTGSGKERRGGPLSGIRVLALENYLAGNHVTFLLGLFGAEILKVEQPGVGDALRGPENQVGHLDNKQQGKKSVAIDVARPAGRHLFFRLVERADVVFTNQKPASLRKLGITYEALQDRKRDVVYTTLSGFGHDDVVPAGPFGDWPAFDVIAQGVAGLQFRCLGPNSEAPGYNGIPLGDDGTAILAALGTVLALRSRDRDGTPQRVDVAMHDAMVYFNGGSVNRWRTQGDEADRGRSTGGSAPYGAYRTQDGWVNIAVWGENLWHRFCAAIGRPDAAEDPRFQTARLRLEHLVALNLEVVEPFTTARPTAEIIQLLHSQGVPVAPVFTTAQTVASPQVAARKLFTPYYLRDGSLHEALGSPIKMGSVDESVPLGAPPRLGEHTREVLENVLQMHPDEVDDLVGDGVLQAEGGSVP
jgi:formyl-CoA transferase